MKSLAYILKYACALLLISLNFQGLNAQENRLHFDDQKEFKIVQFTDMHFYLGGSKSQEVIDNIHAVMQVEKPDLVVLTGDIVTCSGKLCPTFPSWDFLTGILASYKVPYAIAFGNHDDEAIVSREELLSYLAKRPYCLLSDEAKGDAGGYAVAGTGNYTLPVYNGKGEANYMLYCMDSRSYSTEKDQGVKGYGWFDRSQIEWFASTNKSWLDKNPETKSLLFFHIPLPEYKRAFDEGKFTVGVREEKECAPEINTGMFAELLQQGNVLGCFVGHDHDNNYVTQLYNIALGYGCFSGGNSYFNLPMNGARVIVLKEGKDNFTTWIRLRDGQLKYKVKLPQGD